MIVRVIKRLTLYEKKQFPQSDVADIIAGVILSHFNPSQIEDKGNYVKYELELKLTKQEEKWVKNQTRPLN